MKHDSVEEVMGSVSPKPVENSLVGRYCCQKILQVKRFGALLDNRPSPFVQDPDSSFGLCDPAWAPVTSPDFSVQLDRVISLVKYL